MRKASFKSILRPKPKYSTTKKNYREVVLLWRGSITMTTIVISQNTHIQNKSNISLQKTNGTLLLQPPPNDHPHKTVTPNLKKGRVRWTMPSLELSFLLVKRGAHSCGRDAASTANPWFWDVMKQRPVPSCTHGWLCPRFPYLQMGCEDLGTRRKRKQMAENEKGNVFF